MSPAAPPRSTTAQASSPWLVLPSESSPGTLHWTLTSLWTRYCVDLFWLSVYATGNALVFWLRSHEYPHDPCVGLAPAIAKGSAEIVMLNVVLTLLSVCHRVLDRLRGWSPHSSSVASLAQRPMEMSRVFHVLTGSMVIVSSLVHSLAWAAIIVEARACEPEEWQASRLAKHETHELRDQASVWRLLLKLPLWTGVVMLLCVILLLPFCIASVRRRYFQAFARVHGVVLVPLVTLLLIHGAAQWSSRFQAPLWLLPAIVVYAVERRSRLSSSTSSTIVSFGIHSTTTSTTSSSKATTTLSLYLTKTPRFQRCFQPGMFVYLQVPTVSAIEWHPFSVASCQDDALIELRVRVVGDWTTSLLTQLSSLSTSSSILPHHDGAFLIPATVSARIDGPFGTPTTQYSHYDRVALIALGVGVSPFLSILRHELHAWRRLFKLHRAGIFTHTAPREIALVWVVREPDSIHWLAELLLEFRDVLPAARHALDLHVYVTKPSSSSCEDPASLPAIDPTTWGLEIHNCDGSRPQWTRVVGEWTARCWHPQAVFVSGSRAATSAVKSAVACQSEAQATNSVDVFAEVFH